MSPTSTTISAHINEDIPDIVIHTPHPALHIRDMTLPSADPANRFQEVEFRTLDYDNDEELFAYFRTFWDLPESNNDYFIPRTDDFVRDWIATWRKPAERELTFAGIALHAGQLVGLHILRRLEEWEQICAHIAGLWVHPDYRRLGIARELKRRGEQWAREAGATFLNTNVQAGNDAMLAINEKAGFTLYRYNLRKRL